MTLDEQSTPDTDLTPWLVVDSGRCEPAWNMALDEAMLCQANVLARPMLRFYGWLEPAATFGYFQRYADLAELTPLRPLLRRPTGGGLVPHDRDWTYSLAFPVTHPWYRLAATESYRRVHEWIRRSFARLGLQTSLAAEKVVTAPGKCFAGAERHDLLLAGAKIAGAAQRRNRLGLLIQGSVQPPQSWSERQEWQESMCLTATEAWGVSWERGEVPNSHRELAASLTQQKYTPAAYHRQR